MEVLNYNNTHDYLLALMRFGLISDAQFTKAYTVLYRRAHTGSYHPSQFGKTWEKEYTWEGQ